MKQLRSTVFLILIAAIVGGYIYFNERGPIGEEGSTELLRTDPARIQQIKLQGVGPGAVVLRQSGDTWTVEEAKVGAATNTAVPADPTLVKTLTDGLQLVQTSSVITADPAKLKEFGLDKPTSRLEVDGTKLEFGTKPAFDQSRVYARVGEKIGLLPASLSENTSKAFADWRDKSVLRVKAEEVSSLNLTAPLVKATFQKNGEKWNMITPVAAPADSSSVDSFITSLSSTQSTAWLEDKPADLSKWGLKAPQATIEAGSQTLKVGKKVDGGYAAQNSTSAVVFTLPDTLWGQINRAPREWRDKKVAQFTTEDVTGLTVAARGASKALSKVDDKWQVSGGAADDKIHMATTDLIFATQGWSAVDFVDEPSTDKTYGFDRPELILTVAGKNADTLTVGRTGGKAYVRNQAGTIFVLSEGELANVKSALDTLFASPKPAAKGG